jgi:hypothetical protein
MLLFSGNYILYLVARLLKNVSLRDKMIKFFVNLFSKAKKIEEILLRIKDIAEYVTVVTKDKNLITDLEHLKVLIKDL